MPKTSPGAQNVKTGRDALGTAENEFGSAKLENGIRRPWYRRKRVRARKKENMGPDAPNIVENESVSAKCENSTRLPRYHRKRVRERRT
jgi:hypothetical protein